ncbi:FAD-dependent oxidoreductase [Roseiarcaceae bacterium H3SJ34-1]|uniref:FAD-dependent oxidoreductase n=1 Tax=Terripilifer ovatus TaxID=3032367 RepID=UPI003AB927DC|nr:FAD-dependent oxidoreductase [Roseiarcaceae bacterium H3SJ34-1]
MVQGPAPSILEPARSVPVYGEYEIVVLGGGPAGIAAAVAAGRSGRSTLLIERYGFLGGMGTAAGVTNFCGLHANVHGEKRRVVHGVANDLLDRIEHLGGLREPHDVMGRIQAQAYDTSAYKIAADELLLSASVDILFHALASGLHMETPGRIDAIFVETKSGRQAIKGQVFIDCSGDGDLAAWAGAPFELGDGQGNMLYPSSMFRINAVDAGRADHSWTGLGKLMAEAERTSNRRFPRKSPIVRPHRSGIEWRANMTQLAREDGVAIDGTNADDLSRGEIIGRRQIADVFNFLKTVPGFENSYIVDIAPQIGIRETRRTVGRYMLSEDDVLNCASFDDTIGVNGWPIEAHVSGDVVVKWAPEGSRGYNQLPFRMLLPQQVSNLMVAGRCASMTHMGQSAARVSGACFVMGQAAGTAADMAIAARSAPEKISVVALQDRLQRDGAFLGHKES